MKKFFSLIAIICGVLLLTGCGGSKTYTCVGKGREGADVAVETVIATFADDKVESFDLIIEFKDEDTLNAYKSYLPDGTIKGNTMTIKKANESELFQRTEIVGLTKDEFEARATKLMNQDGIDDVSCK